jgi:uncharacterized protein
MDDDTKRISERLVAQIKPLESCLVAYSGGVDSAVVAKAAYLALGDLAVAITGVSASLAAGEFEAAQRVAAAIGIRHESLATDELADPSYLRNGPDRCFHCKTELYEQLRILAGDRCIAAIVNGANADDLGDFRPGMQAATNFAVHSPLADCGLTKDDVRALARYWKIEVWDKPATPCLSSRVLYGVSVTPERLAMIDAAEQLLRSLQLGAVRVRLHENELARLEVPLVALARVCESGVRQLLVDRLHALGFRYVTLDLEGFRSGSFQQLISSEELIRYSSQS